MKKITKRLIALIMMFVMLISSGIPMEASAAASTANLGKLVDSYETKSGEFKLTSASRFFVVSDSEPTGDLLQTVQLIQRQFATEAVLNVGTLDIVWGPVDWAWDGDIVLNLDTTSGLAAEAYELDVTTKATVKAKDVDGLLYGANMLQKYFRIDGNNTLSGFEASDAPDTKERTVMLDCGRKYYTKNYIVNFIREMSWMGYNTIELHFSEDSGFRMDFWDEAGYQVTDTDGDGHTYNPQNDFSWLCGGVSTSWTIGKYQQGYDGEHLSTADIIEILETAKEYHLDVIPSFDTPAHCDYLTWQFQQNYNSNTNYSFIYDGKTYTASSVGGCINYTGVKSHSEWYTRWPYFAAIDINSEVATAFAFALYTDIADFFKEYAGSVKFNIAADEVNLSTSNLSSTYATKFKWGYADFPAYVNKLDTLLNDKGYTTRIFNDFIGTTKTSAFNIENFNDDIEILYWISPFNPTTGVSGTGDNQTNPVSYFVNDNRTVYNVMGSSCYYCTRITRDDIYGKDARDPDNRQWQVYASNEKDIYNKWYPADISAKGDYDENVEDVPEAQLGGGYFCIWHDFQAMNNEVQIWNGAKDRNDSSKIYYLRDRMWSNTIKQWNWDVNNSLSFANYEDIRDAFGDFPGAKTYSGTTAPAVTLPSSTTPTRAYRADHTALKEALETKLDQGEYSAESYERYISAYNAAEAVDERYDATADELANVLTALNTAKAKLAKAFNVVCKRASDQEVIATYEAATNGNAFSVYLKPLTGYEFKSADCGKYLALPSKDGSGFLAGNLTSGETVVVWYNNAPTKARLNELANEAVMEQSAYTAESWAAYTEALNAARANFTPSTQSDVDAKVKALEAALTGLVASSGKTEIIKIEKLADPARLGKKIGLKVTTTPDVSSLTVEKQEPTVEEQILTVCTGKVQKLDDDSVVKIWLVNFETPEKTGEFTYTVKAGSVSETVKVNVQ